MIFEIVNNRLSGFLSPNPYPFTDSLSRTAGLPNLRSPFFLRSGKILENFLYRRNFSLLRYFSGAILPVVVGEDKSEKTEKYPVDFE